MHALIAMFVVALALQAAVPAPASAGIDIMPGTEDFVILEDVRQPCTTTLPLPALATCP